MQQLPPGPRHVVHVHVRRRLVRRRLRRQRNERNERKHHRRLPVPPDTPLHLHGHRLRHGQRQTAQGRDGRAGQLRHPRKAVRDTPDHQPNDREAEFQARAVFYDDEGTEILDNASYTVKVPANGTATTRVTVGDRLRLKVDHCKARPKADARP